MLSTILRCALIALPLAAAAQVPPDAARSLGQSPATGRSLATLKAVDDPAWPLVQKWLAAAPNAVVLPVERISAEAALTQMQVTLRSPMGAVVYHTGGILIDDGWLRILGSGSAKLPRSLPGWNKGRVPTDAAGHAAFLLVADDVLGGFFAVNGGGLTGRVGNVFYLAPSTLEWEDMSVGYSDFLQWALSPRVAAFYAEQRWPCWQAEVRKISGDKALSVYPFLWTKGPAIEHRSRRVVPVDEVYGVNLGTRRKFGG